MQAPERALIRRAGKHVPVLLRLCGICLVSGIVLATGCIYSETPVYQPEVNAVSSASQLSALEARQSLRAALSRGHVRLWDWDLYKTQTFFVYPHRNVPINVLQVTGEGYTYSTEASTRERGTYKEEGARRFAAEVKTAKVVLVNDRNFNYSGYRVGWVDWASSNDARRYVDAIVALNYYSSDRPLVDDATAFAEFQERARAWRALPQKPVLPEEVQRLRVLAEDAIRSKKFEAALGYYEKALALEPLWAQGQFNVAIINGELEIYSMAALHMKRYLELSPDAKDAGAAREKLYLWEEKAKQAGSATQTGMME